MVALGAIASVERIGLVYEQRLKISHERLVADS